MLSPIITSLEVSLGAILVRVSCKRWSLLIELSWGQPHKSRHVSYIFDKTRFIKSTSCVRFISLSETDVMYVCLTLIELLCQKMT